MKKSKRVVTVTVFLTLLLACAAALSVGCERKTELKAPTGLELTATDVLEWDEVEGAASYTVDIDGEEYLTRTNSLDVFEILDSYKTYRIKVAANSEKGNVRDSEWSEEMTIEQERPDWFGFLPTEDGRGWEATEIDKSKVRGKLIIPAFFKDKAVMGVTGFSGCGELKGVILPDTVEYVNAFSDCEKLARMRWSASLKKISNGSFRGAAVETLVLPEGVTEIKGAFSNCRSLKSISLPSTLRKISEDDGSPAFYDCPLLESIEVAEGNEVYKSEGNCIMRKGDNTLVLGCRASVIPAYTEHIGVGAFRGAGLEQIVLPEGVTSIENSAFSNNDCLTEVSLPQSLTSIGRSAFSSCAALREIIIPDGVTTLPDLLFFGCTRLKAVSLGAGLESISGEAFELCAELERITVSEENAYFKSVNDGKFLLTKTGETLVLGGTDGKIPDGVKTIGDGAFFGRTGLKDIIFPDGLERIGEYAFSKCMGLSELKLPRGLKEIGNMAFGNCLGLFNIRIPDGVTSIGANAFSCYSMGRFNGIGFPTRACPVVLVVPDSVEVFGVAKNYTIYTSYASRPSGWGYFLDAVVVWDCGLDFDDDGLPFVVSAPNAFSGNGLPNLNLTELSGSGFLMHAREGYVFEGWATAQGGEPEFPAFEKAINFVPFGLGFDELYLREKTFRFAASLTEEQCGEAKLTGAERLYAVWKKEA